MKDVTIEEFDLYIKETVKRMAARIESARQGSKKMRLIDILKGLEQDYKLMLRVSGLWIGDIEQLVSEAYNMMYTSDPSPLTRNTLLATIRDAKVSILKAVALPFIDEAETKVANRILKRYHEYFHQLINLKV